ncbi:glycosyltransferase family 1 protein [Jeotgalibacillus proteolyticus]|uniref:Glycosyltransferase family 1 protein n=1 Tax=Jeotgalibacillus proteolyticus TaxID=2082395 RepID=A0A2S5G8B4_9BACL|nr:glycosyltransferase family 1 protein [Jeotgalibacillus proteolyticus]PPA69232.1 glycosyltransferase family 1 protein [Jeotgalibacillus proteolyticus]
MKQEPKRILQVSGAMNRAGTETMLMNLYRRINKKKLQFDFVSYSSEEAHYDQEIEFYGGKIIRLSNPSSVRELVQAIKDNGPYAAVHSHTLFHCGIANTAARIAGIKVRIAHAHTTQDDSQSFSRRMYLSSMRQIINYNSTHLLACSKGAGKYLFGEREIEGTKYSFIPNAINVEAFLEEKNKSEAVKFKEKHGLEGSLILGHIGRFIEAKNHLFLLEVLEFLLKKEPSAKLLLVGDGDEKEKINVKAKEMGIEKSIVFAGLRQDIPVMLQCMDVFVFPSVYEGLGLVLLEAQASGVPCLVSEAIQEEADLGMGLISRRSLSDSTAQWVDEIISIAGKKLLQPYEVSRVFETKEYTVASSIRKLAGYYLEKTGGANEKDINFLI